MNILQKLYNDFVSERMTRNQFLTEVNKYPQYRKHFSNSNTFTDIVNILKRKQLIVENTMVPSYTQNKIEPIDFNSNPSKEVHVIKFDLPSYIQFIHNDTLRQVDADDVQSFIDTTYDGDTSDKEDLEIVTDLLMHNKENLDKFSQVETKSLDELDGMKQGSQKVVKFEDSLNEELSQDNVSTHEFNIGFNIENETCKDSLKATKKVLKNLEQNPKYYTDLVSKHNSKLDLRPQKLTDDTLVDKLNPMSKIKIKPVLKEDLIQGGLGDNKPNKEFDKSELIRGTKHEMEHTKDPKVAMEIAKDHLTENPNYYKDMDKAGIDENSFQTRLKEELQKYFSETKKLPSAGLSKQEKSEIVKKAKAGHDFGKKGKGFEKIEKSAEKSGYSKEVAQKIVGASFWKKFKR